MILIYYILYTMAGLFLKDLNMQHFMDMLQENKAELARKRPVVGGAVDPLNDETVDDIVDVWFLIVYIFFFYCVV